MEEKRRQRAESERERKVSSLFSSSIARGAVHSTEEGCTYCDSNIQGGILLLFGFRARLKEGGGI